MQNYESNISYNALIISADYNMQFIFFFVYVCNALQVKVVQKVGTLYFINGILWWDVLHQHYTHIYSKYNSLSFLVARKL